MLTSRFMYVPKKTKEAQEGRKNEGLLHKHVSFLSYRTILTHLLDDDISTRMMTSCVPIDLRARGEENKCLQVECESDTEAMQQDHLLRE